MASSDPSTSSKVLLGIVLFPGFEPLDVCGPVNLFAASQAVEIIYIAQAAGPVTSVTGAMTWVANHSFSDVLPAAAAAQGQQHQQQQQEPLHKLNWLLVPGGVGTRREVNNPELLKFIQAVTAPEYGLQLCMSVCTGAPVLAAAGVLDGKRATSNKNAFDWVTSVRKEVKWLQSARWVHDGMFVTSSGVTAGADMAVYVMKQQFGSEVAAAAAKYNEYIPHTNPDYDPFADRGFVPDV